jgi:demethoxyubiquinone hydroxylase (CLK1/Coq7/Cat5 family)
MNKATCSLNFMYSMERFATAIYRVQKGGFKNKAIFEKLTYAVDNEQQHALKLKSRITELGNTPSRLAFLFQIAGFLLGGLSRCLSKTLALKTDTAIEKRAVKDYGYFLRTLELDDKTKQLIKNIITDEERHIRNWQDSIKLLKSKK